MDHTPNASSIILGVGMLFWLIYGINSLTRGRRTKIKLEGMREATDEISFFVSRSYERGDEPLPKAVTEALDYMARACTLPKVQQQHDAYVSGIRMLGEAMGKAARQRGYEEGIQAGATHDRTSRQNP
jgi:hypothetical protein